MPNFKGNSEIIIQPGDSQISYGFKFSVCSSSSDNDGYLPYGTSISSVSVKSYTYDDRTEITDLIDSVSVNNNVVTVTMSYPSTSGAGRYRLKFLLTLDNGSILEADFGRVRVVDL